MHFLKVLLILHVTLAAPLQRLQAAVTYRTDTQRQSGLALLGPVSSRLPAGSSPSFTTEVLSNPATNVPIVQSVLSRIQLLNT